MSLFAALNVAVSGLSAQSQCIGNISDNLANAQTVGFKSIGTTFSDLVTASSSTSNSPGGVRAAPNYENSVQGTISSTSTTTNLAISGQGFFCVTAATQDASGQTIFTGSNYYSRAGDFTLNKDGYMVNTAGYYLQGHTITDNVTDTSTVSPIQISSLLDNPEATTQITYVANLPANGETGYASSAATVEVYDALGSTHQTSIEWTKTANINEWIATVTVNQGGGVDVNGDVDYVATFTVAFNSNAPAGTVNSIVGNTSYYVDALGAQTALGVPATSGDSAVPAGQGASGDPVFVYLGNVSGGSTGNLTFPGAGNQTINLNLGNFDVATGLTQYANTSSTVSVSSISQDGLGEGSFSSIGIDVNGIVSINYTNGSTRKIYQIPLAMFNSPDDLQRSSGGVYTATLESGAANLHLAGTNGAGKFSSSSLEASTVDIASEFTTMIQSQQVYSANAKVVSTVNGMLNTIIQTVQ